MKRHALARLAVALCLISPVGQVSLAADQGASSWKEAVPKKWITSPLKSWTRAQATCDTYQDFWVVQSPYSDRAGSEILVFRRTSSTHFPDGCELKAKDAWVRYHDDDYGAAAISGEILFLDSGTSNWRALNIINLKSKKSIAAMGYNGSVGKFSISGNDLIYNGPLDGDGKDRAAWKVLKECVWGPEHDPPGWFQEDYRGTLRINLKTGKETVSGVTCEIGHVAG